VNPEVLKEVKRALRLYGAMRIEQIAEHLIERGIIPDASLPSILSDAVDRGELRTLVGSRGRLLYAMPLEETL
jgi:hypothetical protein